MRPPPFSTLNGVPCCNAYLDDLIVYASTWEEHLRTLKLVFTRLHEASLTLNLVGRATITYLGQQVVQSQVCPIEAKVAAIATYPAPSNRRELRRFLGMAGYYCNFCRNLSSVVQLPTSLRSPNVDFVDLFVQH